MAERLVICDDHPLFRIGLHTALAKLDGVQVVGEAQDGESCLLIIERLQPDILLLDLALPGCDGFHVLEWVTRNFPQIRTVILSMHSEKAFADRAQALGACAFVAKEDAMSELAAALAAGPGQFHTSESVAATTHGGSMTTPSDLGKRLQTLSPTERRIMALLARSMTSREIARQLGSSFRTVQTHRAHIAQKLDIQGVNRLMEIAIRYQPLFDA